MLDVVPQHRNAAAPNPTGFAGRLLAWYDRRGRRDLPWRRNHDPYPIWVSEIMLQQTQVGSVIPYFERFLARFPDIHSLAAARDDEVLHLWTGLGYYARARNLLRAAREIVANHGGAFPRDIDAVAALPGVGRSTAGAILAIAHDQRHPILDGNVRRVLARHHRVAGWPGRRDVAERLWEIAESLLPATRAGDYAQAIMDLGATVCLRRRPLCAACPVADSCAAYRHGDAEDYPAAAPRRARPRRALAMLMIRDDNGQVLLCQRPPAGIWGGLWGFPEFPPDTDFAAACRHRLGLEVETGAPWPVVAHGFTHYDLDILPVPARLRGASAVMEVPGLFWYKTNDPDPRGLAAPVKRLLDALASQP